MPNVTPSVLANSIMGKIYDVLTNGDATVPKSADNFFSWCTPGIPMEPQDFDFLSQGFTGVVKKAAVANLTDATGGASSGSGSSSDSSTTPRLTPAELEKLRAQDTAQLYQQAEALAWLVDFVPDVTQINNDQFAKFAIMNNEGPLSERYAMTLKFSQVAETPLSDDEKKKIEHLRSLLTTTTEKTDLITNEKTRVVGPSPLVQVYNEKLAAYEAAALDYNSHRIDALSADNAKAVNYWAINANILRNRVKSAMDDWITNGYKNQYEEIAAYIAQVEGRDLTLLKAAYLDDLDKARLTGIASGSDFYYTSLIPARFATSAGWSNFSFSAYDVQSYSSYRFNASGWEAHGGGGFLGIFGGSGGGGAQHETTTSDCQFNSDYCSMSFQICQIPIVRPWFKSSYLTSKIWRYAVNNVLVKDWKLSDGGSPPKGELPAYPTSVIFIRNLDFKFGESSGFSHLLDQADSSHSGGGGFLAIGPIFLGGSASSWSKGKRTDRNWGFHRTDQGLSVPGMQVIGFKCHVMPKSPNPAPEIKSWV